MGKILSKCFIRDVQSYPLGEPGLRWIQNCGTKVRSERNFHLYQTPFGRDKLLRVRTWKRTRVPIHDAKFYERPWTPTKSSVDRSRTWTNNIRIVNPRQVDSCSDTRNAKPNRIERRKGKLRRKEREPNLQLVGFLVFDVVHVDAFIYRRN